MSISMEPAIPLANNVLGTPLRACSMNPMTGFFRNGCCDTSSEDTGEHTVCILTTKDFLVFSQSVGNDLSTPRPEFDFPGLQAGDKWCLCLDRWIESEREGVAPQIFLEATHESVLEKVPLALLKKYDVLFDHGE